MRKNFYKFKFLMVFVFIISSNNLYAFNAAFEFIGITGFFVPSDDDQPLELRNSAILGIFTGGFTASGTDEIRELDKDSGNGFLNDGFYFEYYLSDTVGLGYRYILLRKKFHTELNSHQIEVKNHLFTGQLAILTSQSKQSRFLAFLGGGPNEYDYSDDFYDSKVNGSSYLLGGIIDLGGDFFGMRFTFYLLSTAANELAHNGTTYSIDSSGSGLTLDFRWAL